ncbi:predicted protein [Plenodomus lingam JN3]|uniref:Uncharacterized protein n=1 Tax=Leptosphaeria maculans (strain JN3 / isolate v23.1.3 / race Av1-4-5-6-7-8) TaxID=985895 RepID=E5A699_LEPMJ|nr:predicted protein [Plenodomus lingam JN3]CBX99144.1 predicted protein [Plenodomus lingam JN3]
MSWSHSTETVSFNSASFRRMYATELDELPDLSSRKSVESTISERLDTLLQILRDANMIDRERLSIGEFLAGIGLSIDGVGLGPPGCRSSRDQPVCNTASNASNNLNEYWPCLTISTSTATQADPESPRLQIFIEKATLGAYECSWETDSESKWSDDLDRQQMADVPKKHHGHIPNNATVDMTRPVHCSEGSRKNMALLFDGLYQPSMHNSVNSVGDERHDMEYVKTADNQRTRHDMTIVRSPSASLDSPMLSPALATVRSRVDMAEVNSIMPYKTTVKTNRASQSLATEKENVADEVLPKDPFRSLVGLARMK